MLGARHSFPSGTLGRSKAMRGTERTERRDSFHHLCLMPAPSKVTARQYCHFLQGTCGWWLAPVQEPPLCRTLLYTELQWIRSATAKLSSLWDWPRMLKHTTGCVRLGVES